MVIKVYVAMISCSQEVKKNQQRAVMILESKNIPYSVIDITDPACEDSKDYMVETATPKEGFKIPFTPQIYNEADYCGDYDGLDMSNECDTLGDFLKLSEEEKASIKIGITGIIPKAKSESKESHITNGMSASREGSQEKISSNIPATEKKDNLEVSTASKVDVSAVPPEDDAKNGIEEKTSDEPSESPLTKEENQNVEAEPVVAAPEPAVTAPAPAVTAPEPAVTAPEPAVTAPEPTVTAPEEKDLDDEETSSEEED